MELAEPIDRINEELKREFGVAFDGKPNFRVIFADDQLEKRWVQHTKEGFELLNPIVEERPKYKQMDQYRGKYILERYVPVPQPTDLTTKVSYEPAWVFRDKDGNYLPPRFDACKFVIDSILEVTGKPGHSKYRDPKMSEDDRQAEIAKMLEYLCLDETEVGDALHHGYGVAGFHQKVDFSNSEKTNGH